MVLCMIVGCGFRTNRKSKNQQLYEEENQKAVSFFRFPAVISNQGEAVKSLSVERRCKWLSAVSRSDITDKTLSTSRVCSRHFVSGASAKEWDKHNIDWVPSLALGHTKLSSEITNKASIRAIRTVKRNKRIADSSEKSRFEKKQKVDLGPGFQPVPAETADLNFDREAPQT